jgi:hypothetical protein
VPLPPPTAPQCRGKWGKRKARKKESKRAKPWPPQRRASTRQRQRQRAASVSQRQRQPLVPPGGVPATLHVGFNCLKKRMREERRGTSDEKRRATRSRQARCIATWSTRRQVPSRNPHILVA